MNLYAYTVTNAFGLKSITMPYSKMGTGQTKQIAKK